MFRFFLRHRRQKNRNIPFPFWFSLIPPGEGDLAGAGHLDDPVSLEQVLHRPELADQACQAIIPWVTPVDLLIIIAIFVQALVLVIMLLSGKSGLSRWFVLMGPVGAITLGVIWKIIFKEMLAGHK